MKLKLSKEKKTIYDEKKLYFENGIFRKTDSIELMNYYLYEIAESGEDLSRTVYQLFAVRDQIHEVKENNDFMIKLCESFLIAHPEMTDLVVTLLQSKGIHSYELDYDGVRLGDYSRVDTYIKKYAKGLKDTDRYGEKPYVKHSWYALEEVCYHLEEAFRDYKGYLREAVDGLYGVAGFRELMAAGKEMITFLNPIELSPRGSRSSMRIYLSNSVTIYQERGLKQNEQWVRKEWELYDLTGDFLYLIYLYTESIMRERLKAPKKARSVEKYMKKAYRKGQPDKRMINLFKKYISNERFEKGIAAGVDAYLAMHQELLPKEKTSKKSTKGNSRKLEYVNLMQHKKPTKLDIKEQMRLLDQGEGMEIRQVQRDKLQEAKEDANDVLEMLHVEEISYAEEKTELEWDDLSDDMDLYALNDCEENRSLDGLPVDQDILVHESSPEEHVNEVTVDQVQETEEKEIIQKAPTLSGPFTEQEIHFLGFILEDKQRSQEYEDFLYTIKSTERLMIKGINEKALDLWEDILLEYDKDRICIIDDYLDEIMKYY